PPLFSDYYEPVWRTCAESGMALGLHAGWGFEQGYTIGLFEKVIQDSGGVGIEDFGSDKLFGSREAMSSMDEDSPTTIPVSVAQAMWQLMLGGVFDRYPDLRLVMVEVRASWIPSTLARLDARFARGDTEMAMKPSEYYQHNVWMAPSFIQRSEIEMRH